MFIENCEYFASYFHETINYCLGMSLLILLDLKLADVVPFYKKKSKYFKDNYRSISILSNISKVYETWIKAIEFVLTLIKFNLARNVDFVEVIIGNTVYLL